MNRHFDRETGRMAQIGLQQQVELRAQVMWQTPVADDAVNRKNGKINSRGEPKLSAQVMWQTPTQSDIRGQCKRHPERSDGGQPNLAHQVITQPLNAVAGGSLNPQFVAWLMGWPLNWTSMEPLPPATWAAWQRAFLPEHTS